MLKKILTVVACLVLLPFSVPVLARSNIVFKGKVTGSNGLSIAKASILVKVMNTGVSSADDGSFEIEAPDNGTLVISSVGFAAQEVKISNRRTLNIVLNTIEADLGEVVVVGYGTQRKKDVTGAMVRLNEKTLDEVRASNFITALQGRPTGVDLSRTGTRPGANGQIRIRGNRSLSGSNDPLIVVDGIPYGGSVNDLNVDDIAAVDILKDASATAITDLPNSSIQSKGRATKPAAMHLLAKVYLTRGWSSAAQPNDFATAYAKANELITNKATYGLDLWQDFADVCKNGNEYGKGVIFVLDRNTDPAFSESGYNAAAETDKEDRLNHFWINFYALQWNVNSDGTPTSNGTGGNSLPGSTVSNQQVMSRDVNNGRPFRRFRPTNYTYAAFNNRADDSRYEKTFQTAYISNLPSVASSQVQTTIPNPTRTMRNGATVTLVSGVDTAIWMPGREVTVDERQAFKGVTIAPSQYTIECYPSLLKHMDRTRLHFNDPSDRPVIFYRLADTYLLAAEAAFKANQLNVAATVLNVIRQRAAYRATNTGAQNAASAAALTITSGNVTLDFILEERTREFFGESCRWLELVRTKTLLTRVAAYNSAASAGIKPHHILRPIPQAQIDLLLLVQNFLKTQAIKSFHRHIAIVHAAQQGGMIRFILPFVYKGWIIVVI